MDAAIGRELNCIKQAILETMPVNEISLFGSSA